MLTGSFTIMSFSLSFVAQSAMGSVWEQPLTKHIQEEVEKRIFLDTATGKFYLALLWRFTGM